MRTVKHPETRTILFHFDSCADYADHVAKCTPRDGGLWSGGESWATALQRARSGNVALVPQAEALIDKIVVDAQRELPVWIPSMAGAFPVVADYMTGRPDCMRRRFPTVDERAPIRIFVELTSSAGIKAEDMVKRGTAILALALLLNMHRPVSLNVIVGLDGGRDNEASFCVVPLGTSPLDIALSCNALTSVGFVRSMGYQYLKEQTGAMGAWAWGRYPEGADLPRYVAKLRQALDATPQDIIIPPIFVRDPSVRDPLGFVQRALAEALKIEQGDE